MIRSRSMDNGPAVCALPTWPCRHCSGCAVGVPSLASGFFQPRLAATIGLPCWVQGPDDMTPGQMTYHLRRLRLHGLIERIPGTHRYQVTRLGWRTAPVLHSHLQPNLTTRPRADPSDRGSGQTPNFARAYDQIDQVIDTPYGPRRRSTIPMTSTSASGCLIFPPYGGSAFKPIDVSWTSNGSARILPGRRRVPRGQ